MKRTLLWFDGAAEPNPGLATYGFVIREDDTPVKGRFIHAGSGVVGPKTTNNVAEYYGLGVGLRWLADNGRTELPLLIRGDSKLVISQVAGEWECRSPHLIILRDRCLALLELFAQKELVWIPRDQNEGADELSRSAWESKTGQPFPQRPTRRGRLKGRSA